MFFLSIFLPLLSYFICIFFKNYLNSKQISFISCGLLLTATILSVFSFYFLKISGEQTIVISNWIASGSLSVDWSINLNLLSCSMVLMVNFVSTLIHIYSVGYMKKDSKRSIFMGYLSLFTFFMLLLVSSNNLLQLFLGWEGVGLTSYLLIGFWNYKDSANSAAIKAFVVNRVGDFGLLLALFTIFVVFGTLNIDEIMILVNSYSDTYFDFLGIKVHSITLISILLFIGCMGKSAQFGLHTWLPDAMEGPTPVSALIHAATMVTAGVFLLILMSPLIEVSVFASDLILIVGSLTCIFAASVAIFQDDIKKIIAYSTCSQLGYMFMAIGASAYSLAYFHLISHAFFKALLFLGAGSVIHAVADEQDMRKMGGLKRLVPFTFAVMSIGSFALMGFPFLTGFYSKDVILEVAFASYSSAGHFAYTLGTLAAFFTAFYSMRLSFLTFLSEPNGFKPIIIGAHDSPIKMALPLFILAFPSIFIGYLSRDLFIGLGTGFWNNAIFVFPTNLNMIDAEFANQFFRLLPLCLSLTGASLALILYNFAAKDLYLLKTSVIGRKIYTFLNRKWFFDKFYNEYMNQALLVFGYHVSYKTIDRGIIEMVGPWGLSKTVLGKSNLLASAQSGSVYDYALAMFLGLLTVLVFVEFWELIIYCIDPSLFIIFFITFFFCFRQK